MLHNFNVGRDNFPEEAVFSALRGFLSDVWGEGRRCVNIQEVNICCASMPRAITCKMPAKLAAPLAALRPSAQARCVFELALSWLGDAQPSMRVLIDAHRRPALLLARYLRSWLRRWLR